MMPDVRGFVGKLSVAVMLTLCVTIYVLEMSGQWDKTMQGANDEAGIVAVILCVGMALSAVSKFVSTIPLYRVDAGLFRAALTTLSRLADHSPPAVALSAAGPPLLPLRI